jgi:flagella basal body P-ring formation protein FlgA
MPPRVFLIVTAVALALAPTAGAAVAQGSDEIAAAIRQAVVARVGTTVHVEVELLQAPEETAGAMTATPLAGARFGAPSRFVLDIDGGHRMGVLARVHGSGQHVIARRAIDRDVVLGHDDVEWADGALEGQAIEPLPSLESVLAASARRAFAQGEIVTNTMLRKPLAVRAGEQVAMTFRSGRIEVRGIGRAVNSGAIGDIIRVLRPGSRQSSRARIVAPASVEMLK